jgi:hypothetical protein
VVKTSDHNYDENYGNYDDEGYGSKKLHNLT